MCAATADKGANDVQKPQNGPKVEDIKNEPVNKFQGGGGGGPNNMNRGSNNNNNRGGRGGGGNRFNNDRNNRGPRNFNFQPKKENPTAMDTDDKNFNQRGGGPGGNQQNQRRSNQNFNNFNRDDRNQRNPEDRFAERVATIAGPTIELPPIDTKEKKFAGRCRLYIGNLTNDVTKEEVEQLFAPYGEISECFINAEKMFAFIRMDYRANAEKARRELDGFNRKGRQIKVRFAPHSAAVKVKNLNQFVTNELLEWAFQIFGEIERAVVIADERGKSTGEGIVEFARKPGAMQALRRCTEACYFITGSLRPVIVEPHEMVDDTEGYSEKGLFKKTPEFFKEREVGPRFATPGSFEAEYGTRWKALADMSKQKEEALKREMKLEEEKLEAQMEYAKFEHETEVLRAKLRAREQDKERQKREWEMKELAAEEQRRSAEELMRRQNDDLQMRLKRQEEDNRRRQQETSLFAHASQLTSILEQQEQQSLGAPFERRDTRESGGIGGPAGQGMAGEPKPLLDAYDGRRQSGRDDSRGGNRWGGQDRRGPPMGMDDYGKRRRY